jgi:hypothetical protein
MSQTNPERLEKYRGTAGQEIKTADVSSDDHDLRSIVDGDSGTQERIYDSRLAGERFVNFYDDSAAAIREALSNAETACIRRAKKELLESGVSKDNIPNEVAEIIDMAKDEVGYEPLIEVTYNRKADDTRFIIEDNGIGISVEEYEVVQRVGYSTSHDDGSVGGQFGIGWLSMFQLTGVNGMFKMSTKSRLTDEAYSTAEYVANFEMLDELPDEYGTRFEFPSFGEEAKDIDIPSKVAEFAEGMRITVLYREFDESGQETARSDDYTPTNMEDDYGDDSFVVIAENEYFKAVMSPDSKERGRGRTTYNITMPIRRNCDAFGSEPSFNARWKWDFRGKREDGPVVFCESDPTIVGQVPKEDSKYERLVDEMKDDCVPMSEVPDDAIVMPDPASSRDSYKSGHDDFWEYVSDELMDSWSEVARDRFEDLDSWDDFLDMERSEKNALFRAYSAFGPGGTGNEPDTITDALEENLGVTVDKDVAKKLEKSRSRVSVVSRGSNRAHTKGATDGRKIWKVIDDAPDGVYMGKSISQKKADIVWGLGETHIVRLESGDTYAEYEDDWNWEKAKDLPNRNLAEKLPELDDDVAEKYEDVSDSESNNTQRSSTGGDGENPSLYRLKVRVGSNSRKYFTQMRAKKLKEAMEDDERVQAGRYNVDFVILHKDDTSARSVASSADRSKNIGATRVPSYVYDYLLDADNIYESMDELRDDQAGVTMELSDGTTEELSDLPETDCLLNSPSRVKDEFEGREDDLVELLGYDSDDFERYTWTNPADYTGSWNAKTDATVIYTKNAGSFRDFDDYDVHYENYGDLIMADKLPNVDESSEEYEALFGSRYGEPNPSTMAVLAEIAERADIPTEDDQ